MKQEYTAPKVSDLGDIASLTLGTEMNMGFDQNPDMGSMAGMGS